MEQEKDYRCIVQLIAMVEDTIIAEVNINLILKINLR